jgi:sec-independent protein translocase protein TatC
MATLASYAFAEHIFGLLVAPLEHLFVLKNETRRFIYTNLTEAFVTYLKVALFSGFFLSFPIVALQVWRFVSPGLFSRERKFFSALLIGVPFFFVFGALFAYVVVIPAAFKFFLSFESTIGAMPLQLETKISEYLSLVMRLLLAFGFSFQLPVVLSGLAFLGMVTSDQLIKRWRFAVLLVTILSAIITPPDAISMILLAIPLLFLYSLTIFVVKIIEKRKHYA